jgi:hypothetical protein
LRYDLQDIKDFLKKNRTRNIWKQEDWFYPGEVIPHSNAFMYTCKKLAELGVLNVEKGCGRMLSYQIKEEYRDKTLEEIK